jgi:bifunctional DNase/RNase
MSANMREVEVVGLALEATQGAPMVVLRETAQPHRVVPIFVGGTEAAAIGIALAGEVPARPLTLDLMAELVESFDARVERVEVTELRDGAFLAELAVIGPGGDQRLDSRPSDAIALALRLGAPLFVSDEVLEVAGTDLEVVPVDEQDIDDQVAAFREELDDLDPADFTTDPGDDSG